MKEEFVIPTHYQYLESYVRKLLKVHPFQQNVFLMLRYKKLPQLDQIRSSLIESMRDVGLTALVADDRAYHPRLWDNICVYMLASKFGVAVFEEINVRNFNPNIAIELGFMIALGRRCLPLKERGMSALPVDISSLIYREFDNYNIAKSIRLAVSEWVKRDLEFSLSIEPNIFGVYRSEWSRKNMKSRKGIAEITGSGNEINIVLKDDRASSYTAKVQVVGNKQLIAHWVNVDHPDDYGKWEAKITEDYSIIKGRWKSSCDSTSGVWSLTPL